MNALRGVAARTLAIAVLALAAVPMAHASADGVSLAEYERTAATVAPTKAQRALVVKMRARATWNRFGTPATLIRDGGYLSGRIRAATAADAARAWLSSNRALFGLESLRGLRLENGDRLVRSNGYAVLFRQTFGGLRALENGAVTVGVAGTRASGWRVAFVSSALTRGAATAGTIKLSGPEAWLAAAHDVGRGVPVVAVGAEKAFAGWKLFGVAGLAHPQRARLGAWVTPSGARRAYEVLYQDVRGGHVTAYRHVVDAETGRVLLRQNNVLQSHPTAETFEGELAAADGACADEGPWTVGADEAVGAVAALASANLPINDVVLHIVRNGAIVASQDTGTSPEAAVYDPPDDGRGTYHVRVCDYVDGHGWDAPRTYSGQVTFSPVGPVTGVPYPPKWKVFPANPLLGTETHPWNYPSTDTREIWCWETSVGSPPVTLPECDREVQNLASRVPWDFNVRTNTPTFTTHGNNATSAEAWTTPLSPGPTGQRPVSPTREYVYPWTNAWFESKCSPSNFTPGGNDIDAAVTNLFVMHNRMHDWSYHLGFTERRWNAQDSNFGTGGTLEGDPLVGDAQAGAVSGGAPSYLGRDNANMIPNPDGVMPITNMYLWQPLAGAFYAPCVDGDYDMAVIGHEFGHLIENRMIGKGGRRAGHHAGAMGESNGDLNAAEYLNEYGFVPVSDENPFAVGAYVTGNKQRGIRSYGMNFPRTGAFPTPGISLVGQGGPLVNPLNFSNMGYDIVGPQVHADGEIWSATNYDLRQALAAKYNATHPASNRTLQVECADGRRPANDCPGNRRWAQIMYDAYVLMPMAPSMLQARDAYLAADMMRFGGANQGEIWLSFARRGFGALATSSNQVSNSDVDPMPDFESPLHTEATVTFNAIAPDEANAPIATARVYVGHYEARTSPIADTNPATAGGNLDAVARFVPGTYEFIAHAPGYGHVRFRATFAAGQTRTLTISMPTNRASNAKGALATGDGVDHVQLIDDTEGTNWDRTGAQPDVAGSTVTVDLQGGVQTVNRVQVSALLEVGKNRFTALRQFQILACNAAVENCVAPNVGFRPIYTSPANAFPGFNPRPVAPEMILRSFAVPSTRATHVQIRVLTNQCTGNPAFQGEQDNDPANATDCRTGSPGAGPVPVFGDLPQVLAPRDNEVHIAELQVFGRAGGVSG
jgi:extracellular elastinolytic metalloproteinase